MLTNIARRHKSHFTGYQHAFCLGSDTLTNIVLVEIGQAARGRSVGAYGLACLRPVLFSKKKRFRHLKKKLFS